MVTRTRRARFAGRASMLGALLVWIIGAAYGADAPPAKPAPPASPPKADLPRQTVDLGGGVTFEMVLIPAGEFDMGSPETEEGRNNDETLHRVRITKPYWLATTELTQAAWVAVMGSNPSTTKGPTLPVTDVSWDDCQSFVKRLNEKVAGGAFRLPTEAEWEYACRAGSKTRFSFGDEEATLPEYAWYVANSGDAAHPVGLLKPDGWGLYDMHGNVYEWVGDWYGEPYPVLGSGPAVDPAGPSREDGDRVFRSGCWSSSASGLRSASRGWRCPWPRSPQLGFRLARTVVPDAPSAHSPGDAPVPPAAPGPSDKPAPPATSDPQTPKQPSEPAPPVVPSAKEGDVPSWAKVAREQIEAAKKAGVPVAFENSIGMRFVLIPAGTFTMGSPETEAGRDGDETQHEVTLTKPYYLGITEVTNAQYRWFKADHDSEEYQGVRLNGDEQPVEQVSWHDAVAFTEWLSGQDRGRTYRLPTEAEWERACRAGTSGRWFWGEDEAATGRYANVADRAMKARWGQALIQTWPESLGPWFVETDDGEEVAASVAKYLPNAYGLHDMVGNVCELCEDWYAEYPIGAVSDPMGASGSRFGLRVFRGGSWHGPAGEDRAAARGRRTPDYPYGAVGFRLAVTVPAK